LRRLILDQGFVSKRHTRAQLRGASAGDLKPASVSPRIKLEVPLIGWLDSFIHSISIVLLFSPRTCLSPRMIVPKWRYVGIGVAVLVSAPKAVQRRMRANKRSSWSTPCSRFIQHIERRRIQRVSCPLAGRPQRGDPHNCPQTAQYRAWRGSTKFRPRMSCDTISPRTGERRMRYLSYLVSSLSSMFHDDSLFSLA